MASFEQHLNSAVVISGITIAPLYASSLIDMNQSLGLLALGMIGGVLPDLDSETSKPLQISFKILSIFLPLLAILSLLQEFTISKILFIWGLSFVILNYGVFKIFSHITVHRGVLHSIPMGLVVGLGIIYLTSVILEFSPIFSILSGCFITLGFFIHLLLDELVSLNALGMHIKNSFGTAFKLYDKNNIPGSVVLYIIIAVLLFLIPIDTSIFIDIYNSFENIKF